MNIKTILLGKLREITKKCPLRRKYGADFYFFCGCKGQEYEGNDEK